MSLAHRAASSPDSPAAEPRKALSTLDGIAITVGMVLGAGIFKFPSLVAQNVNSPTSVMLVWLAGGVIALIGALCYAELTTTYPSAGGDYHFIRRAYGNSPSFLFAWARITVIQTGTVALSAFILGDYLSEVVRLGPYSSAIYALSAVAALTGVNLLGIRQGKTTQNLLTAGLVLGLMLVSIAGLVIAAPAPAAAAPAAANGGGFSWAPIGLAMIFVLYTYGGWNEAAYISAEVRDSGEKRRSMVRVLVLAIAIITAIYLAANFAFLRGLGMSGMAESRAVAADLMRNTLGNPGAIFISILISLAALSTMNATIITGARSAYAWGRDFPLLSFLGRWRDDSGTPANALLVQGAIAFLLVAFGALGTQARTGFETMVEYTAPVFWFFFLLVGISVFVLRRKDPERPRPFRVPLYPITPILFCLVCAYMLRSSLAYTGKGALAGVAVLLAGVPILLLARRGRLVSLKQTTTEI
ncbi:amino acid permease [soil metagenome]|nr:amino acid permease [Chthoniobacterales bacterium]